MSAPLRVKLSLLEEETLEELQKASSVLYRTRNRVQMLKLNAQGLDKGRGAKPKWKTEDIEYIEACLKEEERTYNSV